MVVILSGGRRRWAPRPFPGGGPAGRRRGSARESRSESVLRMSPPSGSSRTGRTGRCSRKRAMPRRSPPAAGRPRARAAILRSGGRTVEADPASAPRRCRGVRDASVLHGGRGSRAPPARGAVAPGGGRGMVRPCPAGRAGHHRGAPPRPSRPGTEAASGASGFVIAMARTVTLVSHEGAICQYNARGARSSGRR